jgi:hypothetical protein
MNMPLYNVHVYREMRLLLAGIEAGSHEEAAALARECDTAEADVIDHCDGDTFAALVDVAGDEEYEQSRFVTFEAEWLRQAAPALLAAVVDCIRQIHALLPAHQQGDRTLDNIPAVLRARAAIAGATAADGGRTLHQRRR